MILLGIDIGGSGIKGAPVDTVKGRETEPRLRIETPVPSTPDAVLDRIAEIVGHFDIAGPLGVTFPGVVLRGEIRTAANLDPKWVGVDMATAVSERLDRPATVVNDADAAGIAEVKYGAARGVKGVVMMLTFGTGIGSALFVDGRLVPNTELGHVEWKGKDAEDRAAARVKTAKGWSWKKWAGRASDYIDYIDRLLTPDLVVIGGGLAKHSDEWLPHLTTQVRCVPASLGNEAGIIGAATAAAPRTRRTATAAKPKR